MKLEEVIKDLGLRPEFVNYKEEIWMDSRNSKR